jgi:membrane protein DedA with SNARE-associated domain
VPDSTAIWFYAGTFCALVAAGLGFPIPEELPIVIAGAAVGHVNEAPRAPSELPLALAVTPDAPFPGAAPWALLAGAGAEIGELRSSPLPNSLRWWIMLPVCIAGVVISDGLLYCVGRFGGRRLLQNRLVARLLTPAKLRRSEENFRKYGILVLLFARFLPGIRSPVFITAGVMRLSFRRFLLADGLYAIPGVSALFFLAFWFGEQFRRFVEGEVARLKPLLILLAISAIAAYLGYHFLRHPMATGDPREEVPLVGDKVANLIEHKQQQKAGTGTTGSGTERSAADSPAPGGTP